MIEIYSFSKTRTFTFIVFTAHGPTVEKLKKKMTGWDVFLCYRDQGSVHETEL